MASVVLAEEKFCPDIECFGVCELCFRGMYPHSLSFTSSSSENEVNNRVKQVFQIPKYSQFLSPKRDEVFESLNFLDFEIKILI